MNEIPTKGYTFFSYHYYFYDMLTTTIYPLRLRLFILLIALVPLNFVYGQTAKERIEEAIQLYKNNSKKEAYEIFNELKNSRAFNGEAAYCMGRIYEHGEGVIHWDTEVAVKWYNKAIDEDGNGDAYAALGNMYMNGDGGLKKNEEKAVKYYKKAAEKGSASGYLFLANIYLQGKLLPKDEHEALRLVRLAADMNHEYAILTLAEYYEAGTGVAKDNQQAIRLYMKADSVHKAQTHDSTSRAGFVLHKMGYSELTGLPLSKTEKISSAFDFIDYRDYEHAFPLLVQASKEPGFNSKAAMWLGCMYDMGKGTAGDYQSAKHWYQYSADSGNVSSMFNLGLLYYLGHGTTVDYSEAFKWFLKAAKLNQLEAAYYVGYQYLYGQGVAKNYYEAITWLKNAAGRNHALAQYHLGQAYSNGWGVQKDETAAQKWYGISADNGNQLAAALYVRPDIHNETVYRQDQNNASPKHTAVKTCCPICNCTGKYGQGYYISRNGINVWERPNCITCGGTGYVMK